MVPPGCPACPLPATHAEVLDRRFSSLGLAGKPNRVPWNKIRLRSEALAHSEEATARSDARAVGRCNQDFHDLLTASAHNTLLTSLMVPLEGRLHWLLRQNDEPDLFQDEHAEMCEAIARHDVEQAGRLALHHVESSRRAAMSILRDRDGQPTPRDGE